MCDLPLYVLCCPPKNFLPLLFQSIGFRNHAHTASVEGEGFTPKAEIRPISNTNQSVARRSLFCSRRMCMAPLSFVSPQGVPRDVPAGDVDVRLPAGGPARADGGPRRRRGAPRGAPIGRRGAAQARPAALPADAGKESRNLVLDFKLSTVQDRTFCLSSV